MCGFFFAKHRSDINNDSINEFLEIECNKFIKNRGPSYQEIYKSIRGSNNLLQKRNNE